MLEYLFSVEPNRKWYHTKIYIQDMTYRFLSILLISHHWQNSDVTYVCTIISKNNLTEIPDPPNEIFGLASLHFGFNLSSFALGLQTSKHLISNL